TGGTGGTTSSSSTGGAMPCTTTADCGAPPNECVDITCDSNLCGTANKPNHTFVTQQPLGDCMKKECDGNGAVVDATDDTDLPVDGLDCTDDVCTNGVATNPNL